MADESVNITWHEHLVSRQTREQTNEHRGCVVWFTGLSGSGKSTGANEVEHRLQQRGIHTFLLDGDNLRHGLNASPQRLQERGDEGAHSTRLRRPLRRACRHHRQRRHRQRRRR